ncbi:MAG: glutaredoxin domain-containing protein [Pseudobdellovibrionaceae bacterium]|jgi:glutaredoxin 3
MSDVKIITKIPCPYCDRAINLLQAKGIAYEKVDLTNQPEELIRLKNETGWKTVPMIFIKGKMIGGYTDLQELENQGKLTDLKKK